MPFSTISPWRIRRRCSAFYDAGCRYLQFDDTAWAYLCSQDELTKAKERGLDVDHLQETYTRCINKALEAKPADMTITTHVCRGNFRSTFISSGGYEPVAENLLGEMQLRRLFPRIRYRSRRRFRAAALPAEGQKDGRARPGYVENRPSRADVTTVKKRIDEATKYVALDQLCLSPQCGFASTEEGNVLAEDEQWAKLRMIVELADEVWGK